MRPFESPWKSLGTLDADATAHLISAAADVALVLDKKGVITDMMLAPADLATTTGGDWVGRPFIDTVTIDSRSKVEDLLKTAAGGATSKWREVNHPQAAGNDLPVRYSAMQIGSTGGVIAIGQDLRQQATMQQRLVEAQASLEREYSRLRQAEIGRAHV